LHELGDEAVGGETVLERRDEELERRSAHARGRDRLAFVGHGLVNTTPARRPRRASMAPDGDPGRRRVHAPGRGYRVGCDCDDAGSDDGGKDAGGDAGTDGPIGAVHIDAGRNAARFYVRPAVTGTQMLI